MPPFWAGPINLSLNPAGSFAAETFCAILYHGLCPDRDHGLSVCRGHLLWPLAGACGESHSCRVDGTLVKVIEQRPASMAVWYDNKAG